MLWYKAWLETRVRFVICLLAITAFGIYATSYDIQRADSRTTIDFYRSVDQFAHGLIGVLWIAAVSFLTGGGLPREKAVGAASFTLALPFSRRRLMGVRVAVCWMEAVALIAIPSAAFCIEEQHDREALSAIRKSGFTLCCSSAVAWCFSRLRCWLSR